MADTQPLAHITSSLYPDPSETALKLQYIGKQIKDAQAPAAVLDAAVLRRNCKLMLDTIEELKIGFRAHIKTHKTTQLTQLQVGKESKSVKLICSTVAEIEHLLPWLLECKTQGKEVNVLYGLPVSPSAIPRLANITRILGEGTIGLFVDHPAHIKALENVDMAIWPGLIPVWPNIDVGGHREGVTPNSKQLADIAYSLVDSHRVRLAGLYTYFNASYGSNSPDEALKFMAAELEGVKEGAIQFLKCAGAKLTPDANASKVTLSIGTTPTVTSAQNLLEQNEGARQYRSMLEKAQESFDIEFHAGVYPLLDMQQLAARARPQHSPSNPKKSLLSYADIGLRILAEVASLYPDREKPQALVAAGSIVLGREPCKSYNGWGVVSPWPAREGAHYDPEESRTGWIVGSISQEHGVLSWEGSREHVRELRLGDKLLVWPNHACIASVAFGYYLIVDSDSGDMDQIQDVWVRWRGW